jgi:hypothetical protein
MISKLISLLLGVTYIAVYTAHAVSTSKSTAQAAVTSAEGALIILIPVAFIWFPEQIGSATGFIGHSVVNAETPPALLTFLGWLLLLALPVLAYYLR